MKLLDADTLYLFPDEGRMQEWFDEFNERFFDSCLDRIRLKVSSLQKRTLGSFNAPDQQECPGFHPERCHIELNGSVFDSEQTWRSILLHEMVHYAVYKQYRGLKGHGKEFKHEAARINRISEFKIGTFETQRFFRPTRQDIEHWKDRCRRNFVIGTYCKSEMFRYEDEDSGEVIPMEAYNHVATFKTTRAYIPEITANLRHVPGHICWFEVTACCQKLILVRSVQYTPNYREEYQVGTGWLEEDIQDGTMAASSPAVEAFGPIDCSFLGKTVITEKGITGFVPGKAKNSFREKYRDNAEEIGKLAAGKLISIYQHTPQWFRTSHHCTYTIKPEKGDYTIEVDSRFIALVAMTPKTIQINPTHSSPMMIAIQNGDTKTLADYISMYF